MWVFLSTSIWFSLKLCIVPFIQENVSKLRRSRGCLYFILSWISFSNAFSFSYIDLPLTEICYIFTIHAINNYVGGWKPQVLLLITFLSVIIAVAWHVQINKNDYFCECERCFSSFPLKALRLWRGDSLWRSVAPV